MIASQKAKIRAKKEAMIAECKAADERMSSEDEDASDTDSEEDDSESSSSSDMSMEVEVSKPKRARGRPRKDPSAQPAKYTRRAVASRASMNRFDSKTKSKRNSDQNLDPARAASQQPGEGPPDQSSAKADTASAKVPSQGICKKQEIMQSLKEIEKKSLNAKMTVQKRTNKVIRKP